VTVDPAGLLKSSTPGVAIGAAVSRAASGWLACRLPVHFRSPSPLARPRSSQRPSTEAPRCLNESGAMIFVKYELRHALARHLCAHPAGVQTQLFLA